MLLIFIFSLCMPSDILAFPLYTPAFNAVAGRSTTVTATDSAFSVTNLTTYTFTAMSLGTASENRYILVGISARSGTAETISTVTVGGISATQVIDFQDSTSNAGLFIAAVPTGATGNVVVTFTGAMVRAAVGLWAVTGLRSTTPFDTATDGVSAYSAAIDIPARGFAVGIAFSHETGSLTWTNLTEDFDIFMNDNNNGNAGFASLYSINGQTNLTVSVNAAASNSLMALASFGP